jgi:serine phosphatase RsbU (regulator of sigma subunit)/integral membrane sensor domain MASE1/anti-sigma regulatory factor (Ser/Thr protein kinase)
MTLERPESLDETPDLRRGATWKWPVGPGTRRRPLLFTTVVVTYAIGSELALRLIATSGLQRAFFIPAGITLAFLVRLPRRLWWIVLVAAGLTEFAMGASAGSPIGKTMGYTTANLIEPLIGAAIVTVTCGAIDLARRRDIYWYTLGPVVIGPGIGAALGAGTDLLFGGGNYLTTVAQWWLGDALGVILVGSAILVWGSSPDRRSVFSTGGVALITGSTLLTLAVLAFSDLPLVFAVLIGVVLAGVLLGVRAVAMTALAVALTIAVMLLFDPGDLIVGLTRASAVLLIELQVVMFALAGLFIAAESHERDVATRNAATAGHAAHEFELAARQERNLAIQIQRSLLPDRLPQLHDVRIAARHEAANEAFEVGGDWYDAIQLGDGRIGLVVGDIVGHGIEAMTSMGRLRTALGALAIHNDDPASLLIEVDEFVRGPDGIGFATVFYAIVDHERGSVQYSSAGHPPALMVAVNRETTWLDQGQGEPLYGEPSHARPRGSAPVQPGATFILYSDGLIERRGESLDVGLARLERLAAELSDQGPEAICDGLISAFRVGASGQDDVVVLVMKVAPDEPARYHETFPATPDELRRIRVSVSAWAVDQALSESTRDDLLIAVGEATANAVRHAYPSESPGRVTVSIKPSDHVLEVAVIDNGTWRSSAGESKYPGMGTPIIRAVTQEFQTESTRSGTQVTFHVPISTSG